MGHTEEKVFEVDESSDLPIWAQLRNRLSYLIRTGYFEPEEQLPSVRSLAAEALINYNTVTKAYRDLEGDGFIDNVRGRGMFVAHGIATGDDENIELTDSLLRDCIRRYHAFGLSFEDINMRMCDISDELKEETKGSSSKKRRYLNA